jgi:hypothetical protein
LGTPDDVPSGVVTKYYIPASVITALSNLGLPQTVGGLLELANRALAAMPTGGATVAEINQGVDAINRGFDRCRFIVDCASAMAAAAWDSRKSGNDGPLLCGDQSLEPVEANLPTSFELGQNYPNPFNPNTRITLGVPQATSWSLSIYNVKGQLVKRYEGATGGPAFVDVVWDGTNNDGESVGTGVYIYRLRAGTFSAIKKMVLLK